jgi:ribosomal protein S19
MLIENLFYFLKRNNIELQKNSYLKVLDRSIKVNKFMLNYRCAIYNGRFFIPLNIKLNMHNYLFSSFIFTKAIDVKRAPRKYEYKYKKKKEKSKKKKK